MQRLCVYQHICICCTIYFLTLQSYKAKKTPRYILYNIHTGFGWYINHHPSTTSHSAMSFGKKTGCSLDASGRSCSGCSWLCAAQVLGHSCVVLHAYRTRSLPGSLLLQISVAGWEEQKPLIPPRWKKNYNHMYVYNLTICKRISKDHVHDRCFIRPSVHMSILMTCAGLLPSQLLDAPSTSPQPGVTVTAVTAAAAKITAKARRRTPQPCASHWLPGLTPEIGQKKRCFSTKKWRQTPVEPSSFYGYVSNWSNNWCMMFPFWAATLSKWYIGQTWSRHTRW